MRPAVASPVPKDYAEHFRSAMDLYPGRIFGDVDRGVKIASADFSDAVAAAAALAGGRSGRKRQAVGVCVDSALANVAAYYGIVSSGNVYVPISQELAATEIQNIISATEMSAIFTDPGTQGLFKDSGVPLLNGGHEDLFAGRAPRRGRKPADPTLQDEIEIFFTSGTTSVPKGVVHTQASRISNAKEVARALGFTKDDNLLSFLPLTHTASWTYIVSPGFFAGSSIFFAKKFSRSGFWRTIAEHRITYVQVVPTILMMLLNPPDDVAGIDISSLRAIGCGSAPLPVDVLRRFEKTFGVPVTNLYGLSETGPTHYISPSDARRYSGSLGLPFPGYQMQVVDPEGRSCRTGEAGEILIKAPSLMKGYFKLPKLNAEVLRDGWFSTGDIGCLDGAGHLYLKDRKKDLIIKGGVNIYPSDIDSVLFRHPAVHEACTVGIPDDIYGEQAMSFVVKKAGQTASERELLDHCRQHLEEFKCPARIEFVASIPKGATGKLLRRKLQKPQRRAAK